MSTSAHWLDEERLRVYPRIFVTMFTLSAIGYGLTFREDVDPWGRPLGADFVTFWAAARLVLEGRPLDVYQPEVMLAASQAAVSGATSPYLWFYPPTFLAAVAPLGLIAYRPALILFMGLTLVAFVLALKPLIPEKRGWWLVAAFPGVWVTLAQGQNSLLTAALAGGALHLLPKRPWLSGVLIGLLAFKPQLAILFPVALIAGRQWRAITAAAITATAYLAASAALFGRESIHLWLESLGLAGWVQGQGLLKLVKMPSALAWLQHLGVHPAVGWTVQGAIAGSAAVAVFMIWRRTQAGPVAPAALMVATFLVLPYSFDYDLAWLAFPVAWLTKSGLASGWAPGQREVILSLWVLPILLAALGMLFIPVGPAVLGTTLWMCLGWPRANALRDAWSGATRRWSRRR